MLRPGTKVQSMSSRAVEIGRAQCIAADGEIGSLAGKVPCSDASSSCWYVGTLSSARRYAAFGIGLACGGMWVERRRGR